MSRKLFLTCKNTQKEKAAVYSHQAHTSWPAKCLIFCVLLIINREFSYCQQSNTVDSLLSIPVKQYQRLSEKVGGIEQKIDAKTEKYLSKLQKQEAKLKKKLSKIDSLAANNIFNDALAQYEGFRQQLNNKKTALQSRAKQYLPFFDTLKTSFKFLEEHKQVLKNAKESSAQVKETLDKISSLDDKLQQTENIRRFIKERKQLLSEQLNKFGLAKHLTGFNKTAYYYSQQLQEYRDLVNQPEKLMAKSMGFLRKLPAFRGFMSRNSELATLFPMPGDNGFINSNGAMLIPGLQTRAQVQQQIQTVIGTGGPGITGGGQGGTQALLQQNLQDAQAQFNKLKDKLSGTTYGAADEMPEGFKPNNQKTKPFLKRLEYGTNFQSQKSNYFFPTTTDIGLSIGYKINDKSIIGIGSSFKMGFGQNIQNIKISAEGLSLRSFVDIKLKGSFYMSGGFEYNYQPIVTAVSQISKLSEWQQSGLLGVSKTVSIKSKFFKKTKLQLLWDFLSYQQRPVTQPLKFRVGYSF